MVEPPYGGGKRKQFHEALLRQLYPSSPPPLSPPPDQSVHQEAGPETEPPSEHSAPLASQEEGNNGSDPNCTDSEEEGVGEKKLTRSQRKRVKKKKLKEWAALCAKMRFIGPRLPSDAAVDQTSLSLADRQTTDSLHETDNHGEKETVEEEKNEVSQLRAKKVKSRRNAKRQRANTSAASS
ncbi:uncharacterized protein LOC116251643 isoform X2 [Nymphaea colorata]|uniref:uncharacterized protein LOC116251643 isoform X2 n=1 Tax=Nymphaea colorata TaxID=210225 RepID=UPI00129E6A15|nr:uncharacterized protein LOC116251643 isoform X2 [Nymphaea colorata]